MTPFLSADELDALQWVEDCGGSMRAINNPLAAWLVAEGYVDQQGDSIFINEKGRGVLSPTKLADHHLFMWDTIHPPTVFEEWIINRSHSSPLIILAPKSPPVPGGPNIDLLLAILASQIERAFNTRGINSPFFPPDFPTLDLTQDPFPLEARQKMMTHARPLLRVYENEPLTQPCPGDLQLLVSEINKGNTTIVEASVL